MSAFLHDLKLWLSYETFTVSKVLQIKCKTLVAVSDGGGRCKEWKLQKLSQCRESLLLLNAILGKNFEKGLQDMSNLRGKEGVFLKFGQNWEKGR